MTTFGRRSFLGMLGAGTVAASMSQSIAALAAIPAAKRTGTIKDVEHIVVIQQENRAFDHYFGSLRGVRGFADPRAVQLPNGRPVWFQPDGATEVPPFRPDDMAKVFLPDPPHGWTDSHRAWNDGRYDQWVPAKGISAMTYYTRKDLPFYYALADAFTICDAYYCSVMGPTDPNRYHLWTGWVGNDGKGGGPVVTNAEVGYDWTTFPERLVEAGISWKVYQDIGHGLTAEQSWGWTGDAPWIGNFGDNSLLYFHQYQDAAPGTPLADGAKTGTNIEVSGGLFDQFRADVEGGTLPQVSWVAAPEAFSEHPNWIPEYGVWYVAQLLDILAQNPDVAAKTVVLIGYDEAGGFFDHVVPPSPASSPAEGGSTVDIVNEIFPGEPNRAAGPYGLGTRVPLIAVSPWSKGGYVNSEVFDHTSVIKFIEARFSDEHPGLVEPNITPWRRSVVGDLTSIFDFEDPDRHRTALPPVVVDIPADITTRFPDADLVAPSVVAVPAQEKGVRPARALPYAVHTTASVHDGTVTLEFVNVGAATAVFHVRSARGEAPRSYTVEAGKKLAGSWPVGAGGYDLSVYGPNGFFRKFAGSAPVVEVKAAYPDGEAVAVTVRNTSRKAILVTLAEAYTGKKQQRSLAAGASVTRTFDLDASHGWYEVAVTVAGADGFVRTLAGHVETGEESISDPAFGSKLPLA